MNINYSLERQFNPVKTINLSSLGSTPEILVMDVVKESMRCFAEYLKYREDEKTERIRIKSQLAAINEKINAQKEIYIKIIETSYAERKELYNHAQKTLELAMEMRDFETLKETYNFILMIYQSSININFKLTNRFY